MFDLRFSRHGKGKGKAHFQVENGLFLHDLIAKYLKVIAKVNVLSWQTTHVNFANTPC